MDIRAPRAPGLRSGSMPAVDGSEGGMLRRQVAVLQQELALTQHRLATVQEDRIHEADRMSAMLARMSSLEAATRTDATRSAPPDPPDSVRSLALADAERQLAESRTELVKLAKELDDERQTSAWLRAAQEQTTKEVTAFRARATAPDVETPEDLKKEIVRLTDELAASKGALTSAVAAHESDLRSVKAENSALSISFEEAEAEAKQAASRLRDEHAGTIERLEAAHTAKLGAVVKDTDEQIRGFASQLAANVALLSTVKQEKASLEDAVLAADGRSRNAERELETTTEMLAILIRSHEALEAGEEQISKLREAARASRLAIADQTVSLRVALSRAADAVSLVPRVPSDTKK